MPKLAPQDDRPPLISTAEAAAILDCHVRTIHRLVEAGRLAPAAKVPGRTGAYLFNRADVVAIADTDRGAA